MLITVTLLSNLPSGDVLLNKSTAKQSILLIQQFHGKLVIKNLDIGCNWQFDI